ncbi:MAG: oligosaccharide flippase family protein [Rhodothermaceae bacterium]|nr:oligosaccharide flippase family protein [Rhodothermaceae bacterium]
MLLRLARQSGVYALGNVVLKASGLVLAVFYLDPAYLPQADFGYLAQLDALARLLLLLGGLGLPLGLIKFATATTVAEAERGAVPSTALAVAGACATVLFALGWVGAPALAETLLDDPSQAPLIRLFTVYIAFKTVGDVGYAELRARERPGLFVLALAIEWLALIGGVVYFLAVQGEGLLGVMKGYAISAVVIGAGLGGWVGLVAGKGVNLDLAKRLIVFGAPLVAAGLASRFLSIGDRFLIDILLGPAPVAVYEWGAKLGGTLNLFFVQSFQLAFTVIGLKALAADEAAAPLHRRVFRHFTIWTAWAVLGLTLLSRDVTSLLTDEPDYLEVEPLVLLIALGFLMNGIYFIAVNVLYAAGRTRTVAVSVGAAALLNVALNLLLIPMLGLIGAAVATFVAYGALAGWTAVIAEREIHAGYPWPVLVSALLLVLGLWALAQPSLGWGTGLRLVWRFALIGAYVPLVFVAGLYHRGDIRLIQHAAQRFFGREHGEALGASPPDEMR